MRLLLFCVLFINIAATQLPPYFPTCYMDDPQISDCLLNAANTLRPYVINGIKEIKLPSLNPYTLPNFFINHTSSNFHILGDIKKFSFLGFDKYEISELQFYPKDVLLRGKVFFHYLPANGLYNLSGYMGPMSLSGEGPFATIIQNVTFSFSIIGDLISKEEVQYCKMTNLNIRLNIERFYVQIVGSKNPNSNANEVFRKKSDVVALLVKPMFEEIFKKYIKEYLDWFLSEFSFSVLFPTAS